MPGVEAPHAVEVTPAVATHALGGHCGHTDAAGASGHGHFHVDGAGHVCSAIGAPRAPAEGLDPPVRGVSKFGSLLIAPEEIGATTKTGESDDSVLLDCAWMPWLHRLVSELHSRNRHQSSAVFDFDYPEFCAAFQGAVAELSMTHLNIVPYAWRHSGPSIDRARNLRSLQEVQKRGRWRQAKSVNRYEKAGRLGMGIQELTSAQRAYCELAERHLEATIFGLPSPLSRFRRGLA